MKAFIVRSLLVVVSFVLLVQLWIFASLAWWRYKPVETTMFMRIDYWSEPSKPIQHEWRDYDEISEYMKKAIVAAEDGKFMQHHGFDWDGIQAALERNNDTGKVVAGGAMMGPAVENLSYPTTKTTSGLILLSKAAAQPAQVNPCIRCGRCVEYCPMGLEPVEVNQAYAARDVQELGKLHADYCFNCGSCSFVCPAKRPVTQMMSLAKAFYLGEIKKGGNK